MPVVILLLLLFYIITIPNAGINPSLIVKKDIRDVDIYITTPSKNRQRIYTARKKKTIKTLKLVTTRRTIIVNIENNH